MKSDFAAARQHLEQALAYLDGDDARNSNTRGVLDMLVEAVTTAEFRRVPALVIPLESYRSRACNRVGVNSSADAGNAESPS